ncbi:hypothetical protein M9458_032722, partial [Cirrhinus mrigala]
MDAARIEGTAHSHLTRKRKISKLSRRTETRRQVSSSNQVTEGGMVCEKGIQILLTIVGAFASFGLMTVAIGTDYWLYSRALICNSTANTTQEDPHNKEKKDPGALTHSGL